MSMGLMKSVGLGLSILLHMYIYGSIGDDFYLDCLLLTH